MKVNVKLQWVEWLKYDSRCLVYPICSIKSKKLHKKVGSHKKNKSYVFFHFPQCRSDLYKVSCKVHKKVTKKFYSWKRKHWKVVQSSVCGSKKLFYYPSLCVHRPLTHQFLPTTSGIIARASRSGRLWRTLQNFPLQVKIMPVLQDCVS